MIDDNISLKRVFDVLAEIAEGHEQLADNDIGPNSNRGTSKGQDKKGKARELNFPYLFTDISGIDLEIGKGGNVVSKTYKINLFVGDKQSDAAENDTETLSDCDSILTDIIMYFTQNPELRSFIIGLGVTTLEPVRHTTIQNVNGFQATLAVRVKAAICYELLPFKSE